MPFVTHEIQAGETLQQIAAEKLHNVGLWTTLVKINNLRFPYIVKTEKAKEKDPLHLVTYGDTINLVPDNTYAKPASHTSIYGHGQHIYDSVFGMDLQLGFGQGGAAPGDNFGDQVAYLKPNKDHGDVGIVTGLRNLLQSLTIRLITEKGTLPYHPQFGSRLNQFIGTTEHTKNGMNANSTAQDIENEIERVCKTDTRVKGVKVILCRLYNENFFAIVRIKPISPYSVFKFYIDSFNGDHIEVSWDRDD